MIRFLFIILAVVAAILAFLFEDMGWLYLVAGALLLISAVLVAVHLRGQFRRERPASRSRKAPTPLSEPSPNATREELSQAGIIEVRPMQKPSSGDASAYRPTPPGEQRKKPDPSSAPRPSDAARQKAPDRTPAPSSADTASRPPESPQVTPTYQKPPRNTPSPDINAALKPFLSALQSALGVHTAGLFRIEEASSRYRLVSVVSRTPHVLTDRSFSFRTYFLSRLPPEPTVLEVGDDELPVEELGYYKNPPAISHVAVAPVQFDERIQAFLVVDLLSGDPPLSEQQLETFADSARVLAGMMNLEPGPPADTNPLPAAPRGPRLRLVEVGRYTPHREVIAEEMQKARRKNGSLALALVYLYEDVSEFASEHNLSVQESEQIVLDKLRALTSEGRVERFGEMGFGVFHYGDLDAVTAWVERAQDTVIASDPAQTSRLSIGVAFLSDRHENPDDFQVDAARALREAYETGHSTILVDQEAHS